MPLASRLTALAIAGALWPAAGAAQPRPGPAPAPVDFTGAAADRGVEVGASSMVVAIFPTLGGQVSIPAGRRVRVEFGGARHAVAARRRRGPGDH